MAKKKNIKNIIDRFVILLSEEFRLQKVILFGSYAKGHPHKNSDIDVALVSPDFGKGNEMEEMTYLLKKAHEIDIDIEPHPYNPCELIHPHKSSFVYEILRTGKVVYSRTASRSLSEKPFGYKFHWHPPGGVRFRKKSST